MSEDHEINPDHVAQLRAHALTNEPSSVLELLIKLVPDLESFGVTHYFKAAFPEAPLRTCIEAQAPGQLYEGGISDDEFNALFAPWLKGQPIPQN